MLVCAVLRQHLAEKTTESSSERVLLNPMHQSSNELNSNNSRSSDPALPDRPRALLITLQHQMLSGRVAVALYRAGFTVHSCASWQSTVNRSGCVEGIHRLNPLRVGASIRAAILASQAIVVLPCDDAAVAALLALSDDPAVGSVVTATFGDPSKRDVMLSKSRQIKLARSLGLPIPETLSLTGEQDFEAAMQRQQFPFVLKSDGTSGGAGVIVVSDASQARLAWRRLTLRPGLFRTLSMMVYENSIRPLLNTVRFRSPAVDLQALATGAPANRAVLCENGRVLAGLSVSVIKTANATGPASVVRIIDHSGMAAAASAMVAALGLSGVVGFDFMLDHVTDTAVLLEMNVRPTPTFCLPTSDVDGIDIAGALYTRATGRICVPAEGIPGETVALFPSEWLRDPSSPYLTEAWHDVPWSDQPLIQAYRDENHRVARSVRLLNLIRRRRAPVSSETSPQFESPSGAPIFDRRRATSGQQERAQPGVEDATSAPAVERRRNLPPIRKVYY